MRTTVILNDELVRKAKELAARERSTLSEIVNQGLRLRLGHGGASAARKRLSIPTFRGAGGEVSTSPQGFRQLEEDEPWLVAEE